MPNTKPVVEVSSDQPPSYQLELEDFEAGDGEEAHGDTFKFKLGKGQVIPGWDRGVEGMRAGGVVSPDGTLLSVVDLVGGR